LDPNTNTFKICQGCQAQILDTNRYCNICGFVQNQEELDSINSKWINLKQVALFFIIQIACCLLPLAVEDKNISAIMGLDIIFAIISLIFFIYNWEENSFLLKWNSFSFKKLIVFISLAFSASLAVQFLVGHLNVIIFNKEYSYYDSFRYHQYGKYLMILSIALFPAIFEELAFRGFLMQKLVKVFDDKQAIYISSFMFFIIHFSVISVFWLLPFAILLGYVRNKEKTIWYGVIIHFTFNLVACLTELFISF